MEQVTQGQGQNSKPKLLAANTTDAKGCCDPGDLRTFKSEVRLQDEVYAAALDFLCKAVELLRSQGQAKVGDRHWVSIYRVVYAGSIVAFDLMTDNLMAKEGVVYPSSSTPAFLTPKLPAQTSSASSLIPAGS